MLSFRNPTEKDCELVFNWICDPLTRASSFGKGPETFQEHQQWYLNRIKDAESPYLIFFRADHPDDPVGQVRLDADGNNLVVGVLTAPLHRGQGLAKTMLIDTVNMARAGKFEGKKLLAYIKKDNQASLKAFSAAGFEFEYTLEIKGVSSVLYVFNPLKK